VGKQAALIENQKNLESLVKDPSKRTHEFRISILGVSKVAENINLSSHSAIDTAYYCIKNNDVLVKKDSRLTYDYIKEQCELNNKQFTSVFIRAMAENGYWSELERFTSQKGVFNVKRSADIPWENVATIIYDALKEQGVSVNDELKKYVRLIENGESRLHFAKKKKIHDVFIETCKDLKDRQSLVAYKNKELSEGMAEFRTAEKLLADSAIKWKN